MSSRSSLLTHSQQTASMPADVISVRKVQEGFQFVNSLASEGESDVEMSDDEKVEKSAEANDGAIVTPGELVTDDPIWMRGHGTYFLENKTYASVAGTVSRVNRLLSVVPLRGRYAPETGDHIIGRIAEVGNRRWKVDIGAKQHAVLMLGSVNLPGGVLRRKSESDELQMRNFLKEGDLLNAEVQSLFQDGSASLHTRSLKYGKLRNGVFLQVPSPLIVRSKNHTHNLPGNVTVILGVNGFIWLRKTSELDTANNSSAVVGKNAATLSGASGEFKPGNNSVSITRLEEESSWEIYSDKNDHISDVMRKTITRYSNVIKALAHCEIGITEARVVAAYEASMAYSQIGSLIDKENMEAIGQDVINAERMRGNA
ncbi:Ribosomal RNA-processing protein 4 [Lachancea thermotolerans]|uniref:KLTH0H14696p n=1 Tax=Lachancea thermotolerans (strain ATCC 56472 / CBS 6340 / NRRL Y-8284) TaxID=559295 RepID=C5E3M1_LACTC|nr:KLTH0H14696p [Lachancea thermotolerans CBS 6340]CAR30632.1 KLTH0H14696p [Lachancea thermotolerans CBS 6340]